MRTKSPIYVTIGNAALRRQMVGMLRARGYDATPFSTGSDFLDATDFLPSGIALLDMHLADRAGMCVLEDLLAVRLDIPVVMTSSAASISAAVQAIKRGADDFLEQPFHEQALLDTIENTASLLEERIARQNRRARSQCCIRKLSNRELEVLSALAKLGDNHLVAQRLNLTVRSVETYRSRIMRKCGTTRFSDVVTMCRASYASPG